MTYSKRLAIGAFAVLSAISVARAQTTPQAHQHHPGANSPGVASTAPSAAPMTPPPSQASGPGMCAMMGDGMGQKMQCCMGQCGMGQATSKMPMMRSMMAPHSGQMEMMPGRHVEGRIAFLKAELGIADAQLPQWNVFADALRASFKNMHGAMTSPMQSDKQTTMPARVDAMVGMMTGRLESLKANAAAGKSLYDVLTDAQKKLADDLIMSPMGGM